MNTQEVQLRIAALNQLEREAWQTFKDTTKNVRQERRNVQKGCPHENVSYYSDPYDSSYVCNDCGIESRTILVSQNYEKCKEEP
jgi:hypothetical protein